LYHPLRTKRYTISQLLKFLNINHCYYGTAILPSRRFGVAVLVCRRFDHKPLAQEEIIHIQQWAKNNNLKLNTSKSEEMLFRACGVCGKSAHLPPTCMDFERVATHMLGVPDYLLMIQL